MRIVIATPAARGSRIGNRVTALRWAGQLRALGHRVAVIEAWDGRDCDLLVAVHGRKSWQSVERWRAHRPGAPLVVALAGTDLYEDLGRGPEVADAIEAATRLVVLQPRALDLLPAAARAKARVIHQSARTAPPLPAAAGAFQACLLAHLREVKDPFLAAAAARLLPGRSRIRVVHVGIALDPGAAERARAEESPRYAWLGPRPHPEALGLLGGSRVLLVTSRSEGGPNVASEAIAAGVPVLSTRVDGAVGILGASYPGLFPVGDAAALAALLLRCEDDPAFLATLQAEIERLRPLVAPEAEREGWRSLVRELISG